MGLGFACGFGFWVRFLDLGFWIQVSDLGLNSDYQRVPVQFRVWGVVLGLEFGFGAQVWVLGVGFRSGF